MPDATFRRLTGVRKRTFREMVSVLHTAETHRKARDGKPNHLAVDMRLLMTLEYWREYRTYLHIGHSYGVSESTASRNIPWCEDTLIKRGAFTLPGKKVLVPSDRTYEIVLIDATETPVERPQKTAPVLLGQEKASHPEDAAHRRQGDGHDHLPRTRRWPPSRLLGAQGVWRSLPSQPPNHHRHGLPGPAKAAQQHRNAEKAHQKEPSE